jgi:hypothetical protein
MRSYLFFFEEEGYIRVNLESFFVSTTELIMSTCPSILNIPAKRGDQVSN